MNVKRKLSAVLLSACLMGGLSAVAAAPANAAEWKLVDTKRACNGGSWGQSCTTEKTYKRTSGFCAKPAGSLTGGIQAWYTYCYKTVKSFD